MNSHLPKRLANHFAIRRSDKPDQCDIAAELSKHARDVASLASRLSQNGTTPLNFVRLEIIDFENAIDCEIRTDNKQHRPSIRAQVLTQHLFEEIQHAGIALLAKPKDCLRANSLIRMFLRDADQ